MLGGGYRSHASMKKSGDGTKYRSRMGRRIIPPCKLISFEIFCGLLVRLSFTVKLAERLKDRSPFQRKEKFGPYSSRHLP